MPNKTPEYQREWRKKNKGKAYEYVKKYEAKNPEKIKNKYKKRDKNKISVQGKTRWHNEKTGICFDCKDKKKTEFHHLSYEPNIFIEMCQECHIKRHLKNEK